MTSTTSKVMDTSTVGLPLLILAVTGIYYFYESRFAKLANVLTHSPSSIRIPRSSLPGADWRPADDILRSSVDAAPDCKPAIFYFPKSADSTFYVRVHCPHDPHAVGLTYIYVDPPTARTTLVDWFYQEPSAMRLVRLVTPIHYGDIGGLTTHISGSSLVLLPGSYSSSVCSCGGIAASRRNGRDTL